MKYCWALLATSLLSLNLVSQDYVCCPSALLNGHPSQMLIVACPELSFADPLSILDTLCLSVCLYLYLYMSMSIYIYIYISLSLSCSRVLSTSCPLACEGHELMLRQAFGLGSRHVSSTASGRIAKSGAVDGAWQWAKWVYVCFEGVELKCRFSLLCTIFKPLQTGVVLIRCAERDSTFATYPPPPRIYAFAFAFAILANNWFGNERCRFA